MFLLEPFKKALRSFFKLNIFVWFKLFWDVVSTQGPLGSGKIHWSSDKWEIWNASSGLRPPQIPYRWQQIRKILCWLYFLWVVIGFVWVVCFLFILGENKWPLALNLYLLCPVIIMRKNKRHSLLPLMEFIIYGEGRGGNRLCLHPNTGFNGGRKLTSDDNRYK